MRKWLLTVSVLVLATSARGQVKVTDSEDALTLTSGEKLRGTVVAAGLKAIVIIVDDEERVIPREQVKSMTRGEASPGVKAYATEIVEGVKVVSGVDTGEGEGEGEGADGEAPPAEKPAAAKGRGKGEKGKGGKGKGGKGQGGKGGGRPGGAPDISKERMEELMEGNPGLRDIVRDRFGNADKAREWLKQNRTNPEIQKYLEQFLKGRGRGGPRRK
ncbi:MAG: hypothetical protein ACYTFI_14770 [Planctomycetota bacterium]|jgi:hypothetical protein